MREIEAKLGVADPQIFATLLTLSALGPYTLTPITNMTQHTTYLDTPDQHLASIHATLRVRAVDSHRIGTFKRSCPTSSHIHERDEWEVVLSEGEHPADWPASLARQEAYAVVGQQSLVPLFTVHTRRRTIAIDQEARHVAELCLDEGTVSAAGRIVGFRELEVELLEQGTMPDLEALVALLQAQFPLSPEQRSKKRRGLELLSAVGFRPPAQYLVSPLLASRGTSSHKIEVMDSRCVAA